MTRRRLAWFVGLAASAVALALHAQTDWPGALALMPLRQPVTELNRTNCVEATLMAFHSNTVVKALIFMPGATDELYFYKRVQASLTNTAPNLLHAIRALTNQTRIRATFRPPLLLLHTAEDSLEPDCTVEDARTAKRLRQTSFHHYVRLNDRDWDYLQPQLTTHLHTRFLPPRGSSEAYHFYRHSFVGWNLNGWEMLEVTALAGRSAFTVKKNKVIFRVDRRQVASPPSW